MVSIGPITSSLGEFPGYWDCLWYPCWCPSPFPSPSISRCFSIHSFSPAIEFLIRVSFLRLMYLHPFGRTFTYSFLGEFPGLGLALVPDVVVPKAEHGCA